MFSPTGKLIQETSIATIVANTLIQLDNYEDGIGYSLFFHSIARDIHSDIVEMLKDDIREVSGK